MLYLSKVELKNIRCFSHLKINMVGANTCTLLLGDNGGGKSTVLRSIAMGMCDQSSASALFRELPGDFARLGIKKDAKSYVQIDFDGPGGWRYRIKTEFIPLETFERIEQTHFRAKGKGVFKQIHQDAFPWQKIFVSGYGPGIRAYGNTDYSYYLPVDAVYPLFRYDASLQSPELIIRRLVDQAGMANRKRGQRTLHRLRYTLASLLNLKPESIELTRRGIFANGGWGRTDLGSLGDGYRATTTWTLDLMSWWLLSQTGDSMHQFNASDLAGIVIIDELEQHLHPRWQRTILEQLRKIFPKIQFIVATHSPLVASSCPDVTVHCLADGKHATYEPYGWRAEDVYQIMGVSSSRAPTFQNEVLDEFARLDQKQLRQKLTTSEKNRFLALKNQFKHLPSDDPTRLMLELRNISNSLKNRE